MSKIIKTLLLVALLCVPWVTKAQTDTLTVANGTTTNNYIPIYGYYADVAQHNQIIYPASLLSSIAGDSITGMAFYMASTNSSAWGITATISLAVTSSPSLNSLDNSTNVTQVWQGTLNGQGDIWIQFDNAYPYMGGNLLVDIQTTTGQYSTASFYGISQNSASLCHYYYYGDYNYGQNFLPKTSFLHVEGNFDICEMPSDLQTTAYSNSIDLSWTAASGVNSYNIYLGDSLIGTTTGTTYTISDLDANTSYTVKVASSCGNSESPAISEILHTQCDGTSCDIYLNLSASYSYVWNYASFSVFQNGEQLASFNSDGLHTVPVCSGDTVEVHFNSSYSYYASSITYDIQDGGNVSISSGNASNIFNDNVVYIPQPCPSCIPPANLRATTRTDETIEIAWDPRSDESEWIVYMNDSVIGSAYDTTYSFDNLTPNTNYTIGIQSVCNADDSSNVITRTFKTACTEMILPYTWDWEDIEYNGAWPSCWDRIMNHNTDPSVNAERNHTTNGTYSMYLSASYDYNMFVSGAVPLDGDKINVRFWAYMPTYGSPILEAGVMTSPDDTSTFMQLLTITDMTGTWTEYEFNTSTLDADETYYVAFRYYSTYAYSYGNIDDITISEYSDCQRPTAGWIDTIGYYNTQMSWNAHTGAIGYYVYYNTTTHFDSSVYVYVTDTTTLLNNLLPQTTYTAWVITACNGGFTAGDYRQIGPFTTMTTCAPVNNVTLENVGYSAAQISWNYDESIGYPYNGVQLTLIDNSDTNIAPVVDYETSNIHTFTSLTISHNYTVRIRTMCDVENNNVDTATVVNFNFSTLNCPGLEITADNSSASMTSNPINCYYNYSYAQNLYKASEMPNIDTIRGIYFRSSNASDYDYTIDVYMGNTTLSGLSSSSFESTSNMTQVASSYILHPSPAGWQHIVFSNPFVWDGTSNVIVAIDNNTGAYHNNVYWYAHATDTTSSVYIYSDGTNYNPSSITNITNTNSNVLDIQFDASCDAPACEAPMLTVSSIDSTNFHLSWIPVGEATTFIVTINGAIEMMSNATSYNVTNLASNTVYTVGVGAICITTNDTIWSYRNVRTACANMTLPYYKNFENDDLNEMATCWISPLPYSYGGTSYPTVSNDGYNSNKALKFYANGDNIATSSAIPNSGNQGDKYHIQFYAYVSSSYSTGQAGVMTDPNDNSTFIALKNLTNDNAWHRYDMYTSGLDPQTTYYAAFRYNGSYGYGAYYNMLIDNILIEPDLGCHYPNNLAAEVDSTSVVLSWDNTGTQPAFVVAYRANGDVNFNFMTAQSDSSATITGLNSATTYLFRVGNLCSGGDTLWEEIVVTTNCGITALPFFDDFASETISPCYSLPASGVQYYDGGLFWSSYTGPNYPAVLPIFNEPIYKLEIEFKTKVGPVSQGDAILVGVADNNGNLIQWLDTLTDANQSRSSFVSMTYRFDEYTGIGTRIALGRLYTGSDWALIDDINVREIPGCLPVDSLTAHNLFDPDSSYFTWFNPGDATSYLVYVDTITTDTTGIPTSSLISVTTNSYLVPSGILQGGGKYRFFIKSDCIVTQSPWKILEFGSGEVIMSQNGTDTVTSCGMVIYDNGGPIAGYYSGASSTLVMYPSSTGNRLQIYGAFLSFYNDGNTHLTIYDGDNTSGSVLYSTSYSGPTTKYDSIVSLPLATSTNGPLTVTFSGGTYVNPGFELYVRCIPIVSCDDPSYIQTTFIGTDSASLTWYGNSNNYDVYYREAGASSWNLIPTTSETVTLYNLNSATTYEVQIQAICSANDSSNMSSIFTFLTECNATIVTLATPLVEDFEGNVVPPTCFQLVYGLDGNAIDNPVTFDANAAYSGNQGLRFSSVNQTMGGDYNQTLVSPLLDGDSAMVASFYVKASSGTETFKVGYSTQGNDLSSDFNWQQPITVNNSWMHYTLNIPGNTKYVAINYMPNTTGYYLYVDSLVIAINDGTVECNAPLITSTQSTQTSITVNYASNAMVELGIVAGQTWDSTTTLVTIPAGSSYTFTHLLADSSALISGDEYTIGIRSFCGNDFYSDWTTVTTSTLSENCDIPTLLTVGEVGSLNVVLTWNGGNATEWEIYYTTGSEENSVTTTSTTATLTNLQRNTTYTAKVRAVCGLAFSDWSSSVNFTTLGCQTPTGLSVTAVTETEATLRWTSDDASEWEVAWGTYGFELPYGTTVSTSNNTYHLTGLTAGTTYTFMVRSVCTSDDVSEWSNRYNFATTPVIGIDNVANNNIRIYPNPANDATTITINGINGDVVITILDINGRTVRSESLSCNGDCTMSIEVANLASGTYFVRVSDNDSVNLLKKLIVK